MATIAPVVAAAQEPALLQLIADSQTTNYLAAAALTLLIIEHISTFKEEVEYVWKSRLSLWSVLYVWIRYLTLISSVMDVSFEAAAMITFGLLTILPLKEFTDVGPFLNGCYSLEVPRLFTFYALSPFLMSILMFSMTAYKCGQHMQLKSNTASMPVITLFLRDGVFFFLAMMLLVTAEITIWGKARSSLTEIPIIPATAIPAVLGGRILLNIKNLASHTSNETTPTIELTTLSQSLPANPRARGNRVPWYLQTGEVNDIGNEEM
ncbi:hypothetical protein FB45DRAFT_1017282 [Roridomyces roridus]|uniref:DUF6533 domain-containing protein n=1 Tax=Roridomyces roridus TaxID=1738132 RepID=A0AAD7CIK0_9AGAR|nr:hypothetical protein FB45DRAFT_1017282 [Roridomyces roridus]